MKTGHVKKSTFGSAVRFDASYHMSDGIEAQRSVSASPYPLLTIDDVSEDVFMGNRAKRVYVTDRNHGLPFLSSSDILQADLENVKLASIKYTPSIETQVLQPGWTLISRSGTVGNCAFATRKHAQKLASEDVIRLKPNNILREGVIYAFLASTYGHSLLTQGVFGAVIQHIEPAFIKSLPIPEFPEKFQKEVDDLIQSSARLREEAADLLAEAKWILLDFVNTPFEGKKGCKTAKRTLADIRESLQMRLDPPALMNESVITFEKIQNRCVKLGECKVKTWYPGMFKRCYVADGLPYMQGSSVFESNPFRHCDHLSASRTPKLDELWLTDGLILIACAGTCGQVKLITKEYEDKRAIGSPDIIRLQSSDSLFTQEYLFVYLQLPIVQDYMQSFKYGSVIERFDVLRVESIPVVIPTKELSEKITSLINRYKDCTYKAFCDEEKAITMVEAEIEKWNK